MIEIKDRVYNHSNYRLHTIPTKKFKTTMVLLRLKRKLTNEDVTKRALLPYVLQSGTENLPSAKQIRNRLEALYGASLNVDLAKKGEHHIVTFRLDVANEKFLANDTNVFQDALSLLADILLRPKRAAQQAFDKDIVQKEKRSLKQRIQAIVDDKMSYANMRLIEEMCANEPFKQHVYGDYNKVDALTEKDLFHYYEEVIRKDAIDIYVVGDIESRTTQAMVDKAFQFPNEREPLQQKPDRHDTDVESEKETIEEQDVKQGKLHIGFRTYTTFADEDYAALQVFNGIFGGFPHSKLFVNVREKESLAYYAASRIESHKGLLLVMSGIESGNYEKTVKIIKAQMENMRKGDFTERELEQTKTMLRNQLLELTDHPRGIAELLYHQVVSDHKRDIGEIIAGIEAVTREEVIAMAGKIKLDTVYFLKEKEA